MVMASGPGRRPSTAGSPHEAEGERRRASEAGSLHDRLVAYVNALDSAHDARVGVWVEHSYARAGRGSGDGGGAVRELLAHRAPPSPGEPLDVERAEPPPPEPPRDPRDDDSTDSGSEDEAGAADEWEARLAALAPAPDHLRLARGACEALRRVRLARLAAGRAAARAQRRAEAAWLRRTLAPLWLAPAAGSGASALRPPAWLGAALAAAAPRCVRREYERLLSALRRAAPRLAARLAQAAPPRPRPTPLETAAEAGPEGPWLAWVGGGRWARRLRALVHTREVSVGAAGARAAPDAWCAAAAAAARAALADVMSEAGSRGVVVGAAGGWAALAALLAAAAPAPVRGLLVLGPGNGAYINGGADAGAGCAGWAGWAGALLGVCGAGGAGGWRAAAAALRPRQRVLAVAGADDALLLPPSARLTQDALDAHIAEECVRWIHEVCESPEPDDAPPAALGAESEEEDYAHLPAARPAAPAPAAPAADSGDHQRAIEIVEGRVVSRVSGSTPLALMPPRREPRAERVERRAERREPREPRERGERRESREPREPREPRADAPLAAADILHMPIVFADDDAPPPEPPAPARAHAQPEARAGGGVTVRSGSRGGGGGTGGRGGGFKYTRVIVAKRGAAAARPLLLRRGVRLVPR